MSRKPWRPKKAFDEAGFIRWLGEVEDRKGSTSYQQESRLALRMSCKRQNCQCNHHYPCEAGWVEVEATGATQVRPCEDCRPDLRKVIKDAGGDREKFQAAVRDPEIREAARNETAWQ